GGRARLLDGGCDQEPLRQESGAIGAGMMVSAMRVVAALTAAIIPFAAVGAACADGDPVRGEQRYEDCIACHPVERGVRGAGPRLAGIIGRRAGEIAGYRYPGPLKRSGLPWTPEALDTFIGDPQASVPANRMPYAGMPTAADRADLIAYLQK